MTDFDVIKMWELFPDRQLNPLTKNPRRYYSQSDEDGILEKILSRIGISNDGRIIEYGVGNGTENNSLFLIAKGWSSCWIGGQDLFFDFPNSPRHYFIKTWLTKNNLLDVTNQAINSFGTNNIDVVSLDLDGNDYHFTKVLLENSLYPEIWIAEYNAKFPPGAKWVMPYDEKHVWQGDDYFGASFTSFTSLFHRHGYFPVACSVTGANIFFVKEKYKSKFLDISPELDLYQLPLYYLAPNFGHPVSPKTLESLFKAGTDFDEQ